MAARLLGTAGAACAAAQGRLPHAGGWALSGACRSAHAATFRSLGYTQSETSGSAREKSALCVQKAGRVAATATPGAALQQVSRQAAGGCQHRSRSACSGLPLWTVRGRTKKPERMPCKPELQPDDARHDWPWPLPVSCASGHRWRGSSRGQLRPVPRHWPQGSQGSCPGSLRAYGASMKEAPACQVGGWVAVEGWLGPCIEVRRCGDQARASAPPRPV